MASPYRSVAAAPPLGLDEPLDQRGAGRTNIFQDHSSFWLMGLAHPVS